MLEETWRLWATIEAWWPAVEVLIASRVTNARTEAANTGIKHIKRTGRGYSSLIRLPRCPQAQMCGRCFDPRPGGDRGPARHHPTRRAAISKINRLHLDPTTAQSENPGIHVIAVAVFREYSATRPGPGHCAVARSGPGAPTRL